MAPTASPIHFEANVGRTLIVGTTRFIGQFIIDTSLASGMPTYLLVRSTSPCSAKAKIIKVLQDKRAIVITSYMYISFSLDIPIEEVLLPCQQTNLYTAPTRQCCIYPCFKRKCLPPNNLPHLLHTPLVHFCSYDSTKENSRISNFSSESNFNISSYPPINLPLTNIIGGSTSFSPNNVTHSSL
ncbi:hypothetical protein IFM89_027248 [Coptis chinensis]|uniref:Uncharacterized protein n=1 Tax=Coptis chinensis TaxID=261450 RepID=A0A835H7H1_9MAGN|nr:hypothetical protein IFM89_027248 [Coptis chinensis]